MNSISEPGNSRLRQFDLMPDFGIAHSRVGEFSKCGLNIHSADSLIRNRIDCQYVDVFDQTNLFAYVERTMDMRKKLEQLMRENGDTANSLADKSGVPQPTISRFLSGKHGDPRSSTIKKLAKAYNLTESQLRDDADIDFQAIPHATARDQILDDLAALLPEDADVWRAQIRAAAARARREHPQLEHKHETPHPPYKPAKPGRRLEDFGKKISSEGKGGGGTKKKVFKQ